MPLDLMLHNSFVAILVALDKFAQTARIVFIPIPRSDEHRPQGCADPDRNETARIDYIPIPRVRLCEVPQGRAESACKRQPDRIPFLMSSACAGHDASCIQFTILQPPELHSLEHQQPLFLFLFLPL